jgi:hypothetical protein
VLLPDGTNVNHTNWLKTAGAGGIGNMRRGIRFLKGWRRTHAKQRKGYGPIRSRCHRGHGGRESVQAANRGEAPRCRRAGNCR